MKKWLSPEVPADEEWAVYHQIVVPKLCRSEILSLAREMPLSGHSSINKTYNKILNYFLSWFKNQMFQITARLVTLVRW